MGAYVSTIAFADGGCPVDHDNMSEQQIRDFMSKHHHPPAVHSDQLHKSPQSQCPVDHKNLSKEQLQAYKAHQEHHSKTSSSTPPNSSPSVYDVYGQQLDRANMMPATPNQLPSPGQGTPLSTDREKSSIPKAGTAQQTWTYPSPQMFFNALKRKGKADGIQESDMDAVVSVHNTMNERTWKQLMHWENTFHCHQCEQPKLKRFLGRPNDLSPAAWFRTTFRGYPMPFDRHDWLIDRCGTEDVRYVIDYYYRQGPDPIEIHVRPALDSPSALYDRVRNGLSTWREYFFERSSQQSEPSVVDPVSQRTLNHMVHGEQLEASEFQFLSGLTSSTIDKIATDVSDALRKRKSCTRTSRDRSRQAGKSSSLN
ncbi:putative cytochrome c-type heme lyase [Gracilariopsis chorda]|uniref:Holocytochrome c-type synthase n=1 Tax=Gracilariopsis chorda TaxID=448386 RepID=A0A2V3IF52_9FLOR|nr:putative cytochrome c-type heme lyase [Gracilariopsis chorda]|eukprot:PXF40648.1 putative cytochrome c-type heme lyase [Gracilariopsis chorda]